MSVARFPATSETEAVTVRAPSFRPLTSRPSTVKAPPATTAVPDTTGFTPSSRITVTV